MNARTILPTTVAFLSALCLSSACGALTVTMTGTIETGTLNGNSINDESFVLKVEIATGTDVDPTDVPSRGVFEVSQATMQIGAASQFNFDASSTYYLQQHEQGNPASNFGVGLLSPLDLDGNGFFYLDREQPDLGFPFDPTVIQPFSYSAFDDSFVSQPSSFESGADTLAITALSLAGSSIAAIPEPSSVGLLGLACLGLVSTRRRRLRPQQAGSQN